MADNSGALETIKDSSRKVSEKAAYHPAVEGMARLGYGARGLIYFFMGVLSIKLALGAGGQASDQQGAIAAMGDQPAGWIILWALLIGLVSYSLWGLVRAFFDPLHKGHDMKGMMERIGFLGSAVSYALLVPPTYFRIAGGPRPAHNGAQTAQTQHSVGKVLEMPLGPWLAGIGGLVVIGVGLIQIYRGIRLHFDRYVNPHGLTSRQAKAVKQLGRYGMIARGVLFILVGVLLFLSAYHVNPGKAKGFDGALMLLLHQPYGVWLLGIIALGLIAMGLYSMFVALWFRLKR